MIKEDIQHFDARAAWLQLSPDVQEEVGRAALDLAMSWELGVAVDEGNADQRLQRAAEAGEFMAADQLAGAFEVHVPDEMKRAGDIPRVPSAVGTVCHSCGCSELDRCDDGCDWTKTIAVLPVWRAKPAQAPRALVTLADLVEGDAGGVGLERLSAALQVYVAMRGERITVRAAAEAFNTTDQVIAEVLSRARWASIAGPIGNPVMAAIELAGE
ncbi:hypothetical protein K32_24460 [Kaistia sp. 32K]|uniref:hypothetical protein n=1 Tax=Kaistia sp. 32K TaxID=2795690 RepID=UPI0019151D62|nr:hypothetical protein [Kaistia sp. 32K]BCP53829.1 hypothetical protein K32_24460 [Kaistia sp. 32K]